MPKCGRHVVQYVEQMPRRLLPTEQGPTRQSAGASWPQGPGLLQSFCLGRPLVHLGPFSRLSLGRCKQTQQEAVHLGSSLLPVKDLQAQLDTAVAQEDYQAAAQLRDELSRLQVDNRVGVERANRHFYEAMAAADLSAMQEIWGYGPHVQCIHPVSNCLAGREDVSQYPPYTGSSALSAG